MLDKQFDHETENQGTKNSANDPRKWITTIDGVCPECGGHSLIKYVDDEAITGCLVCGWKKVESIDQSIQKALDELKRTMERSSTSKLFYL